MSSKRPMLVFSIGSHPQAVDSVILREFVSQCAAVADTGSVQQRTAGRVVNGSVIS